LFPPLFLQNSFDPNTILEKLLCLEKSGEESVTKEKSSRKDYWTDTPIGCCREIEEEERW